MLDREVALKTIEEAYAARARGDKQRSPKYWAEGSKFRIAADETLLQQVAATSRDPMISIGELIDRFTFTDLQRLDTLFEDNKVAIRWAVNVSVEGRPPVRTELMDLIHLDDDGRIQSMVQFADTAQIMSLAAAG